MAWFNEIIKLGAAGMMPIIFFILALIFGVKIGKAFKSAVLVGVGFVGINLIVGLLLESVGPAAQDMVTRFGLKFTVLDVGWPTAAQIAWSSSLVPFVIVGAFAVNIIMLVLNLTKTVNLDIFNFWLLLLPGTMIYTITNNLVISVAASLILYIIALLIGDKTAPKIQESYGMKGVSFPHATCTAYVPVGILVNAVIDKIPGLNKIDINPDTITKKLGVLGDSLVLSSVLGAVLGVLAGWKPGNVLLLAVQMAAVMKLLPSMVGVVVEGVNIVREAAEIKLKKIFPNREFFIGMDTALLIGEPTILATGLLLIPCSLLLAVILPGNKMLPFTDLASIVFLISMVAPFCKKNMFRIFITGLFVVTIALYASTFLAPYFTQAAVITNVELPSGAAGVQIGNLVSPYNTPLGWIIIEISKLFA
jgi:PTS system galactitol-specific IIC component